MNEEIPIEITTLPQTGETYFPEYGNRKSDLKMFSLRFLEPSEVVQTTPKQCTLRASSSEHWPDVAKFITQYIMGEDWYVYVFSHHFRLLCHLRHKDLVNVSFYLFQSIKKMSSEVQKGHRNSLAHHGIIKLIIMKGLENNTSPIPWAIFAEEESSLALDDGFEDYGAKNSNDNPNKKNPLTSYHLNVKGDDKKNNDKKNWELQVWCGI